MTTLIIDNYDSFSYNLYQYVGSLGARPLVVRNDDLDLAGIRKLNPSRIILSPGPGDPCDPAYFGICTEVIRVLGPIIPVLGVCLGHQGIAHAFNGRVIRAQTVMHGKTSFVHHNGTDPLLSGIPRAFEAMRYHSLIVESATLPACLEVTAKTWDDIPMALRHRTHPIFGVQFHPESIGTSIGKKLLANFLTMEASHLLNVPTDLSPRFGSARNGAAAVHT